MLRSSKNADQRKQWWYRVAGYSAVAPSCLHTVANRFFNAVCSTKVKWKEVNIVLCLLDVKTK